MVANDESQYHQVKVLYDEEQMKNCGLDTVHTLTCKSSLLTT
jgi:hypothetical protein